MSQLVGFIDRGVFLHPTHSLESSRSPKRIPILFSLSVTSKFPFAIPLSLSRRISNFLMYSASFLSGYLANCRNSVSKIEYSAALVLYFNKLSSAPLMLRMVERTSWKRAIGVVIQIATSITSLKLSDDVNTPPRKTGITIPKTFETLNHLFILLILIWYIYPSPIQSSVLSQQSCLILSTVFSTGSFFDVKNIPNIL